MANVNEIIIVQLKYRNKRVVYENEPMDTKTLAASSTWLTLLDSEASRV